MSGKRKFVDVAKEAMGRSSLSKGMGFSDVRTVLEHVVKHSQRRVRFERKRMKGRASDAKGWSIKGFPSLALSFIFFHSKRTFRWLCFATCSNTILTSVQRIPLDKLSLALFPIASLATSTNLLFPLIYVHGITIINITHLTSLNNPHSHLPSR